MQKKKPNSFWNKSRTLAEARKYKTRREFRQKSGGAYSSAYRNNWMTEVTKHMTPYQPARKWTLERISHFAKKCKSKSEFERKFPNAYNAALKYRVLQIVSGHMIRLQKPHKYWHEARILEIAKRFETVADFRESERHAYDAAKRLKITSKLRSFLKKRVPSKMWTEVAIKNEAKKYRTKSDFRKHSPGAYHAAHKSLIIDEVCKHMSPIGNRYKRGIYAYEFSGKRVYVGLTYDFENRLRGHRKIGPLKKLLKNEKFKYVRFNGLFDLRRAKIMEAKILNKYVREGWKPLNRAKPGALGGGPRKWTFDEVHRVAKQCKTRKEFQLKYWGAAQVAYQKGWIDKVCGHMRRLVAKKNSWSWDLIKKKTKKYKTYTSFIRANRNLYATVQRRGELNKLKKLFIS